MIGEIVRRQIWPPPVPATVVDEDAFAAARRRRLINRCQRSRLHCSPNIVRAAAPRLTLAAWQTRAP